ncbi:MAG: ribonuclease R, partial [Candidatus Latescibacteria bacterium]|nr:ribonuclease R [Candidatus Latescibacterota bacterium]
MRPNRDNILALMKTPGYRPLRIRELSRALKVPASYYREFRHLITKMVTGAELVELRRKRYALPGEGSFIIGKMQGHQGGFGFVSVADDKPDLYISRDGMGRALHGDTVMVKLEGRRRGLNPEGKVIKIVERGREPLVGTYQQDAGHGIVIPDDPRVSRNIDIDFDQTRGAQTGQKVVVRVTAWKSGFHNPVGEIKEVLGFPNDPNLEILSLIRSYDLPIDFPDPVLDEVGSIPENIDEALLRGRLDLRSARCFTIDPPLARDFDDAVSIDSTDKGYFRLGVHIADVSAFVPDGSLVDREAMYRGTSVYLVDRVIPMLPHRLTNEICSLNPDEDRLTMSVFMDINGQGEIVHYDIYESVIRSAKRLTYAQAQKWIETDQTKSDSDDYIVQDLRKLSELSRILFKERLSNGSFDFDLPEPIVRLDEEGTPIDVGKEIRLDSNRLIEECMLAANRTVARHLLSLDVPSIYRIHERPKGEKLEDLLSMLTGYGYRLSQADVTQPIRLQKFMTSIENDPEHVVINNLIIRSMQKARYSVDNMGHYGLAFGEYSHFTSPIRRYPDLVVHRLLRETMGSSMGIDRIDQLERSFRKTSDIASRREKLAETVERESVKIKQVEYMESHIDEELDGVISGIVPSGLFVELVDSLIDGLIHVTSLADDYYHFDKERRQLIGERTGTLFRLGQKLKIRVLKADKRLRRIDFSL